MYSTMEEVDLLKKWVNHAAVFKWLHDRSSKYLSKWNKLISFSHVVAYVLITSRLS